MEPLMRATLAAIALLMLGCRSETKVLASEPPPATVVPARDPNIDVTFVVASDTHFGFGGIEESNQRLVDRVNGLTGRAWPHGGNLGPLAGLVITGDLTEWGHAAEW